jgi:hypothetical protein
MAEVVAEKVEAPMEARKLTGHDRCDQCVGQAYVLVVGLTGELTFCGHHFSKIEKDELLYEKLRSFAYVVQDERGDISDKRAGL